MTLSLRNCTVHAHHRTILSVGRIDIPAREISAVIGPNGAGKSTLLKQFLYHAQTEWCGLPMKSALKQRKIAWVGQHEHFRLPMTVAEYVVMGRAQPAWFRPARPAGNDLKTLLDLFDLTPLQDKRIETLSGGEQQRAAIIRALLQQPELLMLDEPTNHLDVHYQHRLMHHLQTLPQQGTTVVMVLHDLNLAAHYSSHALLMDKGGVAASGATAQVMDTALLSRIYDWPICAYRANGKTWFQAATL
ncbi:ABC transporter ATP-binding protein [Neisseria leonii]|uniref:ABC transporter ATP-binding protein n=1 Tax=Neisseria leonii TaxID=2995413 RepID=UPI00237A2EED|nr:ABC transporter ATP-binding protein [Neisseria sp. 3986]MDD9326271.1 ABC transporter ATP-binding protein [Neisseria sp. 3986]